MIILRNVAIMILVFSAYALFVLIFRTFSMISLTGFRIPVRTEEP
jgi:hypothetical protein